MWPLVSYNCLSSSNRRFARVKMKFFYFLLSCLAAMAFADDVTCPGTCPLTLRDAACTGFKVRSDKWDDYAILQDGRCVEPMDAGDPYDFNTNYLCCTEEAGECCEDYPTGFYVGFGIGIGGVVFMALYGAYLCFGSGSAEGMVPKVDG